MNKRELKDMIDQQHESINSQAEIIRKLNLEIEHLNTRVISLNKSNGQNRAKIGFLVDCLGRVMQWCATDVLLQKTHRERNQYYSDMVRTINTWLNLPDVDMIPPRDMDDIPF